MDTYNARKIDVDAEKSSLGSKIRQLRKSMGKTTVEFGHLARLSDASISRIERGNQEPTAPTLQKIARAAGITLGQLLDDSAPILHSPRLTISNSGGAPVEREGAEMRVAKLCAGVREIIAKEIPSAESAIRNIIETAIPHFFDDWDTTAIVAIKQVRQDLTEAAAMAKRRTPKRPA